MRIRPLADLLNKLQPRTVTALSGSNENYKDAFFMSIMASHVLKYDYLGYRILSKLRLVKRRRIALILIKAEDEERRATVVSMLRRQIMRAGVMSKLPKLKDLAVDIDIFDTVARGLDTTDKTLKIIDNIRKRYDYVFIDNLYSPAIDFNLLRSINSIVFVAETTSTINLVTHPPRYPTDNRPNNILVIERPLYNGEDYVFRVYLVNTKGWLMSMGIYDPFK